MAVAPREQAQYAALPGMTPLTPPLGSAHLLDVEGLDVRERGQLSDQPLFHHSFQMLKPLTAALALVARTALSASSSWAWG